MSSRSDDSAPDYRVLSKDRKPYDWDGVDFPEVPIRFSCLGEQIPSDSERSVTAGEERLVWYTREYPQRHVRLELVFSHHPVDNAVLTNDEAEGAFHPTPQHCVDSKSVDSFSRASIRSWRYPPTHLDKESSKRFLRYLLSVQNRL